MNGVSTLEFPDCDCGARPGFALWRLSAKGMRRGRGIVTQKSDMKRELIALLPRLRRFARTLTRAEQEADDIVQESCLRALARADQWDPAQPLDRWVFRIARNLWISELRKRSVRTGAGQVPAEESAELVALETGEARMLAADVRGLVAALPRELAVVLLTVSVEGYSYADAAELLGIPIGTVMSRIHRARKALGRQIAELEGHAS
jgi:RNA polymerase sigma-70 factor (ECF subfamily)